MAFFVRLLRRLPVHESVKDIAIFINRELLPYLTEVAESIQTNFAQVSTDRLLGRDSPGTGDVEEISLDDTLEFTGSGSIQRAAITGDISIPAGSNVADISPGVIVNADINNSAGVQLSKLEQIPALALVLNPTNAAAVPTTLSASSGSQHLVSNTAGTALQWESLLSTSYELNLTGNQGFYQLPVGFRSGDTVALTITGNTSFDGFLLSDGSEAPDGFIFYMALRDQSGGSSPGWSVSIIDQAGTNSQVRTPGQVQGTTPGPSYVMRSEEEGAIFMKTATGWRIAAGTAAQEINGAITASAGNGSTRTSLFSGIRLNNVLQTSRQRLNFLNSTTNNANIVSDAAADEMEISFTRNALTGAITASANSNATTFAGIRTNGTIAPTPRQNLNFLNTTSITVAQADDSVSNEIELTFQRAALTGAIAASANANTTLFAGIRADGAAFTDRTNLNFVTRTTVTANVTDDAGNDEIEIGWDVNQGANYTWTANHAFNNALRLTGISNQTLAATTNDLVVGAVNTLRVTLTGSQTLTGIVPTGDGQLLYVENVDTTDVLTIAHESASSAAANRFHLVTANDLIVPIGGAILFRYDGTLSRWVGAETFVSIQVQNGATTHTGVKSIEVISGNGITITPALSGTESQQTWAVDTSDDFDWTGLHTLAERSAPPTLSAGQGAYWVDNSVPSSAWFTDDVNADWPLNNNCLDTNTTITSVTNSTSTITGAQASIQAGTLAVGSVYKVEGIIIVTRGATATASALNIELVVDGTVFASTSLSIITTATTRFVVVTGYMTCLSTGAAGTVVANIAAFGNASNIAGANPTSGEAYDLVNGSTNTAASGTTIDTTGSNTILVRCGMSVAVSGLTLRWTNAAITRML